MDEEPVYYCRGCGMPITMLWTIDLKSDREYPDYYHLGCLFPGEPYEETKQPSFT